MHINCFGQRYKIVRVKNMPHGISGYIEFDKKIIKLGEKEGMQTILHECFHAVFYRLGFIQSGISREVEEIIVENISNFMVENFEVKLKK